MKFEIKVTDKADEFYNQFIVIEGETEAEAIETAIEGLGKDGVDIGSIRPYSKRPVEVVAIGKDIYEIYDDGSESWIVPAETNKAAEKLAGEINKKRGI